MWPRPHVDANEKHAYAYVAFQQIPLSLKCAVCLIAVFIEAMYVYMAISTSSSTGYYVWTNVTNTSVCTDFRDIHVCCEDPAFYAQDDSMINNMTYYVLASALFPIGFAFACVIKMGPQTEVDPAVNHVQKLMEKEEGSCDMTNLRSPSQVLSELAARKPDLDICMLVNSSYMITWKPRDGVKPL